MKGKRILLVITGSVAAYKTVDLIRELEAAEYQVTVILTKTAYSFVSTKTIQSLSRCTIYSDDTEYTSRNDKSEIMLHTKLGQQQDLILVAPASANFIAKLALGLADTLSLSTILATKTRVVLVPAMNPIMFQHAATQHNLDVLKSRGVYVIDPIFGQVACGDIGIGKYVGNQALRDFISKYFDRTYDLAGKKAIVTLGGTREPIDSVRFISNYSSGRQGALIAQKLIERGCDVTIIAGSVDVSLPHSCHIQRAYTASEMLRLSLELLPVDIYIGCAAVCDFKPKYFTQEKIKSKSDNIVVEFEPNIDVIKSIGHLKTNRPYVVVGFALENSKNTQNVIDKLHSKNLNLIVLNLIDHIQQECNEFSIFSIASQKELGFITKEKLADALVCAIVSQFTEQS